MREQCVSRAFISSGRLKYYNNGMCRKAPRLFIVPRVYSADDRQIFEVLYLDADFALEISPWWIIWRAANGKNVRITFMLLCRHPVTGKKMPRKSSRYEIAGGLIPGESHRAAHRANMLNCTYRVSSKMFFFFSFYFRTLQALSKLNLVSGNLNLKKKKIRRDC